MSGERLVWSTQDPILPGIQYFQLNPFISLVGDNSGSYFAQIPTANILDDDNDSGSGMGVGEGVGVLI